MNPRIDIKPVDPLLPEALAMIADLDAMMMALYPAESAHLTAPETLAQDGNRFYGATVDGLLRGCGGLLVTDQGYGEIKRIYVSPDARGLGLARTILEYLETEARSLGLVSLKLETGIHQPEALGLFVVCGFTECGQFGDYPANDPNSVFYEKRI